MGGTVGLRNMGKVVGNPRISVYFIEGSRTSLVAQMVKNPPAIQETAMTKLLILSSFFWIYSLYWSSKYSVSSGGFCTLLGTWDFPGGSDSKASVYDAGDPGSIPGLGRSLGEGNGNPLQYYCLENPMTEEPGRLQSMGSQRVGHDWATSRWHEGHGIPSQDRVRAESWPYLNHWLGQISSLSLVSSSV